MARKYLIETYGCQMNVHDSERMAGLLEQAGYEPTADDLDADVVLINTCSVREKAEEKLFTRLGEFRQMQIETGTRPLVAVAGCVAQQEGTKILRRSKEVDVIIGTQNLKRLPMLLQQAVETPNRRQPVVDLDPLGDVSFPLGIARRHDPVKAYVTIIEGCNEFCAFCVVPYTRGHERMRPAADIISEARQAVESGARELQLLGQIVNHYQAPDDEACDFAALLERLNDIPGLERIRFASPHPRHVTPRMIAAMRDLPRVCRHLHLPVQSGSTRILGAMRRRHTREDYLALVDELRRAIPDIALSTDMIVGFPGETVEDFEDHITWTRMFIVSSVADLPDASTAAGRLLLNQEHIGEAIAVYYGDDAGDQLTALLKDHILIAADLLTAAKAGDADGVEDASARWDANAVDIATFLSVANPKNWPAEEMTDMMRDHLSLTLGEAVARLNADWDEDVAKYDQIHRQALHMADMLTRGIVRQFPRRF